MNAITFTKKILQNAFVKWAFYVFFSLLFIYWLVTYDFLGAFKGISWRGFWPFAVLICTVLTIMQVMRGWRLSCFLAKRFIWPEKMTYKVSTLHNFFAMLIPAKMGEFSFLVLAKRLGLRIQDSGKTLLHMRFLDLFLVLLLFVISGHSFLDVLPLSIPLALYLTVPTIGLVVCFVFRAYILTALRWVSMSWATFHPVLVLSILILFCHVLGTWLAVQAFDLDFTFFQTLSIVSTGMLAFALPLSGVGNVGPYHAVWLLAAELYEADPAMALVAGTIYHALALFTLCLQSAVVKVLK